MSPSICHCCDATLKAHEAASKRSERLLCDSCFAFFEAAKPSRLEFVVRDGTGAEWARYLYAGMADSVAARCNSNPANAGRMPFTVEPVAT